MVLRDELFEWFYDEGFPAHVQLNNISGGTDIAGCFGIGNPLSALYVGGCAGRSLGVPVEVFDSTIEGGDGTKGAPVEEGVPGELVATLAFPNMPTQFWGDANGKKYHGAYFERFDSKAASQFQVKPAQWLLTTRQQMSGRTGTLFQSILSRSSSCSTGELTGSSTPPASVSDRLRSIG
jgi:hypothetical protein